EQACFFCGEYPIDYGLHVPRSPNRMWEIIRENSPCFMILMKKQQNIERYAEELYTELKNMSDVERENAIAEIRVTYL
ncbi:hypothetical protein, partial [Bacillus atrophaeus]|nr:hypothetical protein [Bacillus atrophaeus]